MCATEVHGALRRILRGHHATLNALAFSPDGSRLLSGDGRGGIRLWDVKAPDEAREYPENGLYASADGAAVCWRLSAQQVAFRQPDGTRHVLEASLDNTLCQVFHGGLVLQASGGAGEDHPLRLIVPTAPVVEMRVPGKLQAVSPDGQWIAWQHKASGVAMLSPRDGHQPPVPLGAVRHSSAPVFSRDSRRCALDAGPGVVKVFDCATAAEVASVPMHRSRVRGRSFSADGTRLVTASFDGTAKILDLATRSVVREFTGGSDTLWSVALSPDGTRLAAGTGESTVILWDTATGFETGTLTLGGPPRPVEQLTFTLDGRGLIARGRFFGAPR